MNKTFLLLGAINGFLAVAIGAFGAHILKSRLSDEMLTIFQTGVQYHMFHAIGLLVVGIAARWQNGSALLDWSGWAMTAGILVFCGSVYILSITGARWLGAVTPLGGLSFLAGWLLLALAVFRQ